MIRFGAILLAHIFYLSHPQSMLGISHAIFGSTATAVYMTATGTNIIEQPARFVLALSVGILASVLPDIDSPKNTFRDSMKISTAKVRRQIRLWRRRGILLTISAVIRYIIARIFDVLDEFLPHRGPTHYGITAIMLTFIAYWICVSNGIPDIYWQAFGIGYASHLLADGVTVTGVRFLAPFYPEFINLLPKSISIRVGTVAEQVMLWFMVSLLVFGLLWYEGVLQVSFG